jgi:mono/diheme cytochrome c family protein
MTSYGNDRGGGCQSVLIAKSRFNPARFRSRIAQAMGICVRWPLSDAFKQSLSVAVAVAAFLLVPIARAQAPDPADIAAGGRLFRQKGNCQACHGWAGDGRKLDSQMPDGANLRQSVLDRETLILLIKCGRPGTGMPPFDKFAYSDGRCYGLKQAEVRSPKMQMPDPPSTLQAREIDAVADFMFAKIIGQGPMDRAKCIDYWGSDVEACNEFTK